MMNDTQQHTAQDDTQQRPQLNWQRMTLHNCPAAYTVQRLPAGTVCAFCNVEQRAPVKVYRVTRIGESVSAIVAQPVTDGLEPYALPKTMWHGAEWNFGYGGAGAADLALSILADYFGERPTSDQLFHGWAQCWPLHQNFKWAYITPRSGVESFAVSSIEIDSWLQRQGPPAHNVQELP